MNSFRSFTLNNRFFIFYLLLFLNTINNSFGSNNKLSEEWIDLKSLSDKERPQAQSYVSKRQHFNQLIDSQKYKEAQRYSKHILKNAHHTFEDEEVFRNLEKALSNSNKKIRNDNDVKSLAKVIKKSLSISSNNTYRKKYQEPKDLSYNKFVLSNHLNFINDYIP